MTYKKKKLFLFSVIAVLALLYTGSLIFNQERSGSRASSCVWLDPKLAARAHRIAIETAAGEVEIAKKNNQWFILHNGIEYPARQTRVEDFLDVFTQRAPWPVRSTSASSHARFGLDELASRITVFGENSANLLDILLGDDDITGREIYIRKNGENEVRSGSNAVRAYVTGSVTSWYNLRLIPESEDGQIDVDSAQRLTVFNSGETTVLSRKNRAWTVSGVEDAKVDQGAVENYIRIVINAEGDNFFPDDEPYDFNKVEGSYITLEFGNGMVKTINFGESDEEGRRIANVRGSRYHYSIPPWMVTRLFRETASFEMR
jgi:hypothetical protein